MNGHDGSLFSVKGWHRLVEMQQLRTIDLFAELPDAELAKVAAVTYERRYRRGSIVFSEGEPGEAVYFIKSGRVKVSKVTPDGREHIIKIWEAGYPFGLVVLLDKAPYPATAEALEESVVWLIRVSDFDRVLDETPRLALQMLGEVGVRLRKAQVRVQDMAVKSSHGRLAGFLLGLAREQGAPGAKGSSFDLGLTHQELGNLIGASRETVTRILSDFRREKAIEIVGNTVTIIDENKLESWA